MAIGFELASNVLNASHGLSLAEPGGPGAKAYSSSVGFTTAHWAGTAVVMSS
jgi:hypothetical protein